MQKVIALLLIISTLLIAGCIGPSTDVMKVAQPVFDSGIAINSESDVREMLLSNTDAIMRVTNDKYGTWDALEIVGNNWNFSGATIKYSNIQDPGIGWWVGNSGTPENLYSVKIFSLEGRTILLCNDPAAQVSDPKLPYCTDDTINKSRVVYPGYELDYLVDKDGIVYFAGP